MPSTIKIILHDSSTQERDKIAKPLYNKPRRGTLQIERTEKKNKKAICETISLFIYSLVACRSHKINQFSSHKLPNLWLLYLLISDYFSSFSWFRNSTGRLDSCTFRASDSRSYHLWLFTCALAAWLAYTAAGPLQHHIHSKLLIIYRLNLLL